MTSFDLSGEYALHSYRTNGDRNLIFILLYSNNFAVVACEIVQRIHCWKHLEMQRHCAITIRVVLASSSKYISMLRYDCWCYLALCINALLTVVMQSHAHFHGQLPREPGLASCPHWVLSSNCLDKEPLVQFFRGQDAFPVKLLDGHPRKGLLSPAYQQWQITAENALRAH